jgi:hypothetical protein
MLAKKLIYFVLLLCLAGIAVPALYGQGTIPCSNATLNGKYILNGYGTNVQLDLLGLIQAQQHIEDIGYLVLDGSGNVSNGSLNETVEKTSTTSTPSGTYSLLASCFGTITLTINGSPRHYQLSSSTPLAGASGISSDLYLIDTDGGTDIALRGTRTFDPAGGCTTNILNGHVAVGDGHGGLSSENVSAAAQITFNADGTFNLTENGSTNGTIVSVQRSGTYGVQGDCTVQLFADSASGGLLVGTVYLEIPQPVATNASVQASITPVVADLCPGCKGSFELDWQPASNSGNWQPVVWDTGSVAGEFELGLQPPQN